MALRVEVAVEIGRRRTFATALRWPGWCRSGRDEEAALETLLSYAPRYADVVGGRVRGFTPPQSVTALAVAERIPGDASTDFGAPGAPPSVDARPVAGRELARLEAILRACWSALDEAARSAEGLVLRTGPRGGGRDLAGIRTHVLEADLAYLGRLGADAPAGAPHGEVREAFVEALEARARGEVPDVGPRGGKRWSPRFAVRYTAWHALDHAWEIEDRSAQGP
jgi:hypothetical protein